MKKILCILIPILYLYHPAVATNEPSPVGSRSNATGNASITIADPFALFNNQAAMAFLNEASFSLSSERRFMMRELSYEAAGLIVPTGSGVFGLDVIYEGLDLYNEKKIGLAYSRLFSKKIAAGIQLDYLNTSIYEYGSASTFTLEAGMLIKINDKLTTGVHVFNPVRAGSGFTEEKIPSTFKMGLSYQPNEKLWLAIEAKKNIDDPARLCAGVEYYAINALHLRAGFESNPSVYSFGIGMSVNHLKIDLGSSYHFVLGMTPQISISYAFTKKK